MFFIYHHLEEGSFINCYADTDSMCLATTQTMDLADDATEEDKLRAIFDPIVKPSMKDSWEKQWKVFKSVWNNHSEIYFRTGSVLSTSVIPQNKNITSDGQKISVSLANSKLSSISEEDASLL